MRSGWSIEIWVMFLLSALTVLLRVIVRAKMVGLRGWKGDDFIIIVAVLFFTLETVVQWEVVPEIELAASRGLLTSESRKENEDLIRRSNKFIFAGWIFYVCTIWSLKGCMLFFYYRLTSGLKMQRTVVLGAVFCGLTFVASILTIILHCLPISENWDPFSTKTQCQSFLMNTYVIVTSNLITDAFLLCIPIPIVWKVRISIKRKFMLALLMCSGVFVMFASAMRLVMTLFNSLHTKTIIEEAIWPYREIFIAMVVVNAPCVKPFFSSSTWIKSSTYAHSSSGNSSLSKGKHSLHSQPRSQKDNTTIDAANAMVDFPQLSHARRGSRTTGGVTVDLALESMSCAGSHKRQDSQEPINPPPATRTLPAITNCPRRGSDSSISSKIRMEKGAESLVIMTSTTFDVTRNEMKDMEEGRCGSRVDSRCGYNSPRPPLTASTIDNETPSPIDGVRPTRARKGSLWMSDDEESLREHVVTIKAGGKS